MLACLLARSRGGEKTVHIQGKCWKCPQKSPSKGLDWFHSRMGFSSPTTPIAFVEPLRFPHPNVFKAHSISRVLTDDIPVLDRKKKKKISSIPQSTGVVRVNVVSFFPLWECECVCGGGTAVECGKIINYSTCMQQCSRCAELLLLLSQQTLRQDYRNYAHIRYVTALKTCDLENKCISTGTLGIPFYISLHCFFFVFFWLFYAGRGSTHQIPDY